MEIKIRKARQEDLQSVFKLVKEYAAHLGQSESVRTSINDFVDHSDYFSCLLAENSKGDIIGYALFSTVFRTWKGKSIHLDDLFVKEEYRLQFVGTMLACSLIEYAKQESVRSIDWQISGSNQHAIDFYKKMGAIIDEDRLSCHFEIK